MATPTTTILCHLGALALYSAEQAERTEGTDSDVLWFLVDVLRETIALAREAEARGTCPVLVTGEVPSGDRLVSFRGPVAGSSPALRALPGGRQDKPAAPPAGPALVIVAGGVR